MKLDVLDMFCGAGGSSAGARAAGASVRAGIDGWDLAVRTFGDNFEDAAVHHRMLTPDCLPGREFRQGAYDMIIASPECTNHSPAKGSAPRCENSRGTSHYVLGFAARLKPRWIVLENVVQLGTWNGFDKLIDGLREQRYRIRIEKLDASEFGVPQTRRRLFVICDRERDVPDIPRSRKKAPAAASILRQDGKYESHPLYSERRAKPTLERAERAMKALGRKVPFLIVYYGSDGSGGWQSLDRPLRTLTTLDRFGLVTWEGSEPMLRMLQVEELKAAMGFPKSYSLRHGSRRDQIKMLGNGVCPPVMKAVVDTLVND
jgi:DNA (cytosine-5)-methyltransferase 1